MVSGLDFSPERHDIGYPKTEEGHVVMYLGVLAGYTIFIASLFILGGEFWDRLKRLFQWPGKSSVAV